MLMIHKFRDSTRGLNVLLTGLGALFIIYVPMCPGSAESARPTNEKSSRSLKSCSGSRGGTSSFDVGRLSDSEGLEEKERQINGDALPERRLVPVQLVTVKRGRTQKDA
ncbi:uncharacterized protein FPRO_02581 [Fusarium proliferatum ET1]|uniref:Uncharacterized protein n=1 Tax=Fusarium proliferatum (strain ET1) TaxID=1227346 RepID=A0A1L7V8Q8_FUSPR|nr:uncharacterized protein FPRO_02581 [Fusarium proliferatum ET1]CVK88933.1 uncharacterized protein FPRN_02470 [Fusarium proliferatum]CZR37159.1 uncharacterized protein FPRO_02581 [Fusarium proliferatum ET1]